MTNKNSLSASLFGVAFIAALLLNPRQSRATMLTFEKEYAYTASELDGKSSCRAIALEEVKRVLLRELVVYVESVFSDRASPDGRTGDEARREITTLSAGVAIVEVVEEKWDGTTCWLKARIRDDPDDVAKKIEAVRHDKRKAAELEESRKRAEGLTRELERMRDGLGAGKSGQAGKYNDAAQQLSAEDWFNKGCALSIAEKHQQAIEAYSKAVELDPKDAKARNGRGAAYRKLGDLKRAIEDYDKAIRLNPEYAMAYNNRGAAYRKLGDHQRAIEDCGKAVELDPEYAAAYNNRGVAYSGLGDFKRAIEDYGRALEIGPKDAAAYYNRGIDYRKLGDHQRAIEDFDKAVELDPRDAATYYNRGLAYADLGDHQRAIENYDTAIKLGPEFAMVFFNRGTACFKLGDFKRAVGDFSRAIEIDPKDVKIHFNRGNAYTLLGDYKRAIEDYSKVMELDPKHALASNNRGNAYAALGDYTRAIEDFVVAARLGHAGAREFLKNQGIAW